MYIYLKNNNPLNTYFSWHFPVYIPGTKGLNEIKIKMNEN